MVEIMQCRTQHRQIVTMDSSYERNVFSRMEVIEIQTDTIGLFEIENQYSHGLALWSMRHRLRVRHETMNMRYYNLWKGIEQYYRKEKRKVKISCKSKKQQQHKTLHTMLRQTRTHTHEIEIEIR